MSKSMSIELQAPAAAAPRARSVSTHTDPSTGRLYEYDEATGETRWLDEDPPSAPLDIKERIAARKAKAQQQQQRLQPRDQPVASAPPIKPAAVQGNAVQLNMVNPMANAAGTLGATFQPGSGPLGLQSNEKILLEEKWKNALCCCFACCGDNTQAAAEAAIGAGRSPGNHLIITDRQIIHRKEEFLLPRCCCKICACPVATTQVMDLDEVNGVQTTENKCIGSCGLCYVYTIWFFFGIFGGHYWAYSKRFPQTVSHKIFLFAWLVTGGFFGLGWLIDAFRIYAWVSPFTVHVHARQVENSTFIDVRATKAVHAIRNGLYTALAPARQVDPRNHSDASTEDMPGVEHFNAGTNGPNAVDSLGLGTSSSPGDSNAGLLKKTKLVVTGDRILMHHHKYVFLGDF